MHLISHRHLVAIMATASSFLVTSSHAAEETTTFQVTAEVVSACTIAATDLAFGEHDPATVTDGQSTVTVTCTLGAAYQVGLNEGTGTGATTTTRVMESPDTATPLDYGLFQDTTRLINWGNDPGTDTVDAVGTGLAVDHPVFGRIPAGQNVEVGNYSDTITATVFF